MGGKKSSSMSSFCCLCFGRSRDYRDEGEEWERKLRPSDEDRGRRWVGEPDVDKKASDFIARFYASRYMDAERQAIMV
ncbi:hypothetical protein Cni_G20885 [Canna indica]|uniref:Uncharacterized protein n=1 Tax=Canna indica TaxID=4628 RepID=A0AAQ3QL64_9LILI|nr:hypothetical protein Cni_G20885 [Canna indica]